MISGIYYIDVDSLPYKVSSIFEHDKNFLLDDKLINNFDEIITNFCYSNLINRKDNKEIILKNEPIYTKADQAINKEEIKKLVFKYFEVKYINCRSREFEDSNYCSM